MSAGSDKDGMIMNVKYYGWSNNSSLANNGRQATLYICKTTSLIHPGSRVKVMYGVDRESIQVKWFFLIIMEANKDMLVES